MRCKSRLGPTFLDGSGEKSNVILMSGLVDKEGTQKSEGGSMVHGMFLGVFRVRGISEH